jgi:hypothetical protein
MNRIAEHVLPDHDPPLMLTSATPASIRQVFRAKTEIVGPLTRTDSLERPRGCAERPRHPGAIQTVASWIDLFPPIIEGVVTFDRMRCFVKGLALAPPDLTQKSAQNQFGAGDTAAGDTTVGSGPFQKDGSGVL